MCNSFTVCLLRTLLERSRKMCVLADIGGLEDILVPIHFWFKDAKFSPVSSEFVFPFFCVIFPSFPSVKL